MMSSVSKGRWTMGGEAQNLREKVQGRDDKSFRQNFDNNIVVGRDIKNSAKQHSAGFQRLIRCSRRERRIRRQF